MLRKRLLYKSNVPGHPWTINHALGCAHGCKYPCYAFRMAQRFGNVRDYREWTNPQIVENALELLDHELPRCAGKVDRIQLCLSTDPFMVGRTDVQDMSIRIIEKANAADVPCSILTKGVLPPELAGSSIDNVYGISVVTLDEAFREKYEPGAARIADRIEALRYLHERGCETLVHIAPYPTPNLITQNLRDLLEAVGFVDRLMFGKLNYSSATSACPNSAAFYEECQSRVQEFCAQRHIRGVTDGMDRRKKKSETKERQLSMFD